MTKKGIAVLIALALLTVLVAGCRAKDPARVFTAGTTTPITFTFFNADFAGDMKWDDPVAKRITEITGVNLAMDGPVGGADLQAIALMIASGKYPDFIYAKGWLGMLIEAGAVIPLDDLIKTKGNNIRELYGDDLVKLRNSLQDPKTYHVGTYGVHEPPWITEGSVQVQHAVLKELGYPTMKTLDDVERALRAYMAKYPTINGQPAIGISLSTQSWHWLISLGNTANYTIGYPDDGQWLVNQETLEATYKFLDPEMRYWFQWLNRMYNDGILDPETFTQSEDMWRAKLASGRVLANAFPLWGWEQARASLLADGMDERTYAYLPIVADGRFQSAMLTDRGYSGGWGIAISSTCKDPERAFEFLDWMASEEAQILVNWGMEGVNFDVINGKRVIPQSEQQMINTDPDYQKRTGVERWRFPFPARGRGFVDSTGNFITKDSPETIKQRLLPVERETLAAYGAEMWIDLFPSSASLPVSRHGQAWQYTLPADLLAKVVEADSFVQTALANIVIGNPANFDTAWANMVDGLRRTGIGQANDAMTQLIRDRVRLWEMDVQ